MSAARPLRLAPPLASLTDSPWMDARECAAYMKFPTLAAFYKWLQTREGRELPRANAGRRRLLFDRRMVDAYYAGLLPRSAKPKRAYRFMRTRGRSDLHLVAQHGDAQSEGGSR